MDTLWIPPVMVCYGMYDEQKREGDSVMLIDNQLFDQEWFSELPLHKRYLYIYLLTRCTKTGVFEVSLRKINYDLNDEAHTITREDIFESYGNRVQPLGETKGIFVDYIAFNWVRDKPLDPVNNPLHRGLSAELAKYGLTFEKLNQMANKKIKFVMDGEQMATLDKWFKEFWGAYPSQCPRKVDKRKCYDKFSKVCMNETQFKQIMSGLEVWKQSDMWLSNDGMYIKAPLVWLNGECWNDNPKKGNRNGNVNKGIKQSDNAFRSEASDIQNLF